MASITTEKKTGRRAILFVAADGSRPRIRLGKLTMKQAEAAKRFIEDLVACKVTGEAPKNTTAEWLSGLPDMIRRRIERTGLIEPRERRGCPTLSEWLREYVEGRRDVKDATATVYGHTRRNLLAFFGESKRLDEITPGDADSFRVFLASDEGLADNTVRRRLGIAKQFCRAALRRKFIGENPFDGQTTTVRENRKRSYFVSLAETEAVLDACTDARWRLVFALCRFGGLRCPSEILRLKWEDVNWAKMRFTVYASKTEHHADGGIRVVPIFPELYPHLRDAFEQAEPGTVHCCPQYDPASAGAMYRKELLKVVKLAGLKPWPKLFQNCRATRETELAEEYPVQVVCEWIGNSPQVAARHYLQVTDEHYEKAAQNPAQYRAGLDGKAQQSQGAEDEEAHVCGSVQNNATPCMSKGLHSLGVTGLEPVTSSL